MYELMNPDQPNQLYAERVQIGERERLARRVIRERRVARAASRLEQTSPPRPVAQPA